MLSLLLSVNLLFCLSRSHPSATVWCLRTVSGQSTSPPVAPLSSRSLSSSKYWIYFVYLFFYSFSCNRLKAWYLEMRVCISVLLVKDCVCNVMLLPDTWWFNITDTQFTFNAGIQCKEKCRKMQETLCVRQPIAISVCIFFKYIVYIQ